MRVAYYSHYFAPEIGAPSSRIHDLTREWAGGGHAVDVVTCFPNHPAGRLYPGYRGGLYLRETLDGVSVHRHWTYITPNRGFVLKTLGHVSFLPSAMLISSRRLSRPDVVIGSSPTFFAAMAAAALARRHRIPFVMEVRDLWPAIFVDLGVLRNRRVIRWLERLELALYRMATRVVTVTEAFRRNLIERGVPAPKVVTIRNGADVEFWRPGNGSLELRRTLGLDGAFVVLYLGAFGISQALGRVLECAREMRAEPHVRFLLVGDGAERDALRQQAAGLENVRLLDPVDKTRARELYGLADVCLVPLRDVPLFETFIPSKLFEILAMGRPIVASVRGEAAAILEESRGAVVVPPEDSRAMASAIRTLAGRPDLRQAMAERGRDFVGRHFSRRALAGDYLRVLEDAVQAGPPGAPMKVVVTGATGFTGAYVTRALLATGADVRCLVRPSSDLGHLPGTVDRVVGDLDDRASVERAFHGADALMSVASLGFGHAGHLLGAARAADITRAVFFSTTSIFTALEPPTKRVRLDAEAQICASGLRYTILRPTMIYGSARDRNMARLIRYLQRCPLVPVFGNGGSRYQPVHVEDVAAAAVACLERGASEQHAYTVSGASVLTLDEIIDTVGRLLGRRPLKLHVPAAPFVALLGALERFGIRAPLRAEQILRLVEDKAFDHDDAVRDLGYRPRPFVDGIRAEITALARP